MVIQHAVPQCVLVATWRGIDWEEEEIQGKSLGGHQGIGDKVQRVYGRMRSKLSIDAHKSKQE